MLNKIAFLLVFFISVSLLACKCESFGKVGIQYHDAEFVGELEITKIYPSANKTRTYFAEVKTLKTYKGQAVSIIEVAGKIGDIRTPACEFELKPGEKYLFYLSKNDGNKIISLTTNGPNSFSSKKNYLVSACTPKTLISDEENLKLVMERNAIEYLRTIPDNLSQVYFFEDSINENYKGAFKNFEIKNPKSNFAVYKIRVNGQSRVENIEALQNFGSEQDEEILKLIKNNFVIMKGFLEEVKDETVLLTLFYIPENKEEEFKDTLAVGIE